MHETKTNVTKQSLFPVWDAIFNLEVDSTEIKDDGSGPEIDLVVENWHAQLRSTVLGRANIPLAPFRNKLRQKIWMPLHSESAVTTTGTIPRSESAEILLIGRWVHDPCLRVLSNPERSLHHAANELQVVLIRARGLPAIDTVLSNTTRCCNLVATLRVRAEAWKSSIIKHNKHPIWHETCSLAVHACDAHGTHLDVILEGWDQKTKIVDIGRASAALHPLLSRRHSGNSEPFRSWLRLSADQDCPVPRGEVELAMRWIYNPSRAFFEGVQTAQRSASPNTLHLAIVQARGLEKSFALRGKGPKFCNPYVQFSLEGMQNLGCTSMREKTFSPVWREMFKLPISMSTPVRAKTGKKDTPNGLELMLDLQVFNHHKSADDLLGLCQVDLAHELCNREISRCWRKLQSSRIATGESKGGICGEIELEMLWTFEKEPEQIMQEPQYRLHVRDMAASILRSSSDSVIDGAACVGISARVSDARHNYDASAVADDPFVHLRLRIVKAVGLRLADHLPRGKGGIFAIVKQNGREIFRTDTKRATLSPEWRDSEIVLSVAKPQINKEGSNDTQVIIELRTAGEVLNHIGALLSSAL